jgi:ketosteroid isomerase-like protein
VSRENVDFVRRGLEAFNRGNWDEVFERWFDPEIEWSDPPGFPGAGVHHGREAVKLRFAELAEMLEGFSVQPERLFDGGDDVVAFVRTGGRGRASGIDVSRPVAWVLTVRAGWIVKVVGYEDRDAALGAAGLGSHRGAG